MNENETPNNAASSEEEATAPSPPSPPPPNNQPPPPTRSTGDIILQVHIANIFLTFCQRYACLCNRKMRRGLEFIVLLKGIGAMVALIYAHVGYPLSATCLEPLKVPVFESQKISIYLLFYCVLLDTVMSKIS